MTGDRAKFSCLIEKEGGSVTFGGKNKGKIIGSGKVGQTSSNSVDNVLLVDGLDYNLLSISQLCDKGHKVVFESDFCKIIDSSTDKIKFFGKRENNVYMINLNKNFSENLCFVANKDEIAWTWHKRLGHASFRTLNKLLRLNLVKGLPESFSSVEGQICGICAKGKQTRKSFKVFNEVLTSKPLELLHMDLFGPTRVLSLSGKRYGFVIIDDFTRFTWVIFLSHKSDACLEFRNFCTTVLTTYPYKIKNILTDHGGEFENTSFSDFCAEFQIFHKFSSPRTPEQNGVAERKNRTLVEMARTMLLESNLPKSFWAEAVNTANHILNRALVRPKIKKTPYELLKNKKPTVSYFKIFRCKCYVHNNNKENLDKFDAKSQEAIFLGYSEVSRAFRVYILKNKTVEESPHVIFDENSFSTNSSKSCREKQDSEENDFIVDSSPTVEELEDTGEILNIQSPSSSGSGNVVPDLNTP